MDVVVVAMDDVAAMDKVREGGGGGKDRQGPRRDKGIARVYLPRHARMRTAYTVS